MDFLTRLFVFAQTSFGGDGAAPAPAPGGGAAPAAAPADGGGGAAEAGGSSWTTLIFFGVLFLAFYLLLILPQQRRNKKQKEFHAGLKKGDNIITSSGIYGRIAAIDDAVITVEIAKDVKIRVHKSQILSRQTPASEGGSEKDSELLQRQ